MDIGSFHKQKRFLRLIFTDGNGKCAHTPIPTLGNNLAVTLEQSEQRQNYVLQIGNVTSLSKRSHVISFVALEYCLV